MMNSGDIYAAFLDPVLDAEQGGRRPVVIISGNAVNQNAPNVIVCPITTGIKKYHGDVILQPSSENGLSKVSEILNIHIRSISKNRLKLRIGAISKLELAKTHHAIIDMLKY
jgi:mRNA interferase MazF